jgi:hypothetical protein
MSSSSMIYRRESAVSYVKLLDIVHLQIETCHVHVISVHFSRHGGVLVGPGFLLDQLVGPIQREQMLFSDGEKRQH